MSIKFISELKLILCLFTILLFFSCQSNNRVNDSDIVKNDSMAIKIAIKSWLPMFGDRIYSKQPFVAKLIGDTCWEVKGTLNTPKPKGDTIYLVKGGVPHITIRKRDAAILSIFHSK